MFSTHLYSWTYFSYELLHWHVQFFTAFSAFRFPSSEFYCLSIGAKQSGAVLGEVVMEGNVVVFDRANQRIGFAPSNLTHPEEGPCGMWYLYACACACAYAC